MNCVREFGPFCFQSDLKFYIFCIGQTLVWGSVIAFNIWIRRSRSGRGEQA